MTLNDLEWLSKILKDTKHHTASLQQLSFLFSPYCTLVTFPLQWFTLHSFLDVLFSEHNMIYSVDAGVRCHCRCFVVIKSTQHDLFCGRRRSVPLPLLCHHQVNTTWFILWTPAFGATAVALSSSSQHKMIYSVDAGVRCHCRCFVVIKSTQHDLFCGRRRSVPLPLLCRHQVNTRWFILWTLAFSVTAVALSSSSHTSLSKQGHPPDIASVI